jgi:hypothetical protein
MAFVLFIKCQILLLSSSSNKLTLKKNNNDNNKITALCIANEVYFSDETSKSYSHILEIPKIIEGLDNTKNLQAKCSTCFK